jgi:chromosome segregation ATPase
MDEAKTPPGFPGDRSQAAAEKLRALRERASQTLDDHRRRLAELETQLNHRVHQLAEEFGAEPAAAADNLVPLDPRDAEIAELRRQVEEGRAKHEKFITQLAAAKRQLEELASQRCPNCDQSGEGAAVAEEQIQQLRQELESATRLHQEEKARHDKFAEQLALAKQALTELQSASGDRAAELSAELEAARSANSELETKLAAATRDLDILHVEADAAAAQAADLEKALASVKAEADGGGELIAALQQRQAADRTEIERLKSAHAAAEAGLQEAQAAAQATEASLKNEIDSLKQEAAKAAGERDELVRKQGDLMAGKQKLDEALAKLRNTVDAEQIRLSEKYAASQKEVSQLNAALTEARQSADADHVRLAQQYAESQEEIAKLNAAMEELKSKSDAEQFRLGEGQATAERDMAALKENLSSATTAKEAAEKSLAEATTSQQELRMSLESASRELAEIQKQAATAAGLQVELDQARAELAELRGAAGPKEELVQLQQKFDLALADVQKLKRECAALREELDQRPETNEAESPELITVRSERDALRLRVGELEAVASKAVDLEAQQAREDLQRRFEMAVDDVRQLKQENAQLRDKLQAASNSSPAAAPAGAGGDWAAQRARLMAMLEEEEHDGDVSGDRKKERASIESTISMTDAAVAAKEREIAELREKLNSGPAPDEQDRARQELLDADEVIAAERMRIAELEAEWEQKVRAAELEISVERAKLAREQAALKERTLELELGLPQAIAENGDAKPRRRWLSALGLGEEGEEGKKKK